MQDYLQPLAGSSDATGVSIHSGFPNPAADSHGRKSALSLDLNQLLVTHPSSTYLFRVAGHHWAEQGVFDGDIAIVDRALHPKPHDIVLTWSDDENFELHRHNQLTQNQHMWGVVSAIIHPRA